MASLNLCQFIGNVGSIETRYMPSGEAVTNLSLAVNEKYKNKNGEQVEHTEWVKVTFFGKLAEVAATYVHKGDPLYVSGNMKTRKYTDKDGVDKYITDIRANSMQMLGGRSGGESASQERPTRTESASDGGFDDFDRDIPF